MAIPVTRKGVRPAKAAERGKAQLKAKVAAGANRWRVHDRYSLWKLLVRHHVRKLRRPSLRSRAVRRAQARVRWAQGSAAKSQPWISAEPRGRPWYHHWSV